MVPSGPKAAQLWLGTPLGLLASLSIRAGGLGPPALIGGASERLGVPYRQLFWRGVAQDGSTMVGDL